MHAFLKNRIDPRPAYLEDMLKHLHTRYILECSLCGGVGRIYSSLYDEDLKHFKTCPCSCLRFFTQLSDMLVSGVTVGSAIEVISDFMYERRVVEYDIAKSIEKKPTLLFKDHVKSYMRNVDKVVERGYSFLFIGTNSVGKTYMAQKIIRRFLMLGYTAHYMKFRQLMKLINSVMTSNGKQKAEKESLFNMISDVDLLVIDELGKETGSQDHISGEIEQLLKDRDSGRKPTIVITNNDWTDLSGIYSVHVIGAFTRNYRVLIFDPTTNMRIKARVDWDL